MIDAMTEQLKPTRSKRSHDKRRAAGMVRCEVWCSPAELAFLDKRYANRVGGIHELIGNAIHESSLYQQPLANPSPSVDNLAL